MSFIEPSVVTLYDAFHVAPEIVAGIQAPHVVPPSVDAAYSIVSTPTPFSITFPAILTSPTDATNAPFSGLVIEGTGFSVSRCTVYISLPVSFPALSVVTILNVLSAFWVKLSLLTVHVFPLIVGVTSLPSTSNLVSAIPYVSLTLNVPVRSPLK